MDNDDRNEASPDFLQEAIQRDRDWENSLEGVHYQLGEIYTDERLEGIITETVLRLPPDVRNFVYDNCIFWGIASDGGKAFCAQANSHLDWIIILGENADENLVAHEIAHCWLGHRHPMERASAKEVGPEEMAANYKAKEWGFDVQDMIERDKKRFRVADEGR